MCKLFSQKLNHIIYNVYIKYWLMFADYIADWVSVYKLVDFIVL